jgi:hypothetical protein
MNTQQSDRASAASIFRLPFAISEIGQALDAMDEETRVKTVTALGRKQLAALYEAAATNPPLRLTDMVPANVPPMTQVVHEGKNSLGVFTRFQKRFCRPPGDNPTELWGYNEQSMRTFTGPGYFVFHQVESGELAVDYRGVPPAAGKLPEWPAMLPNSARLSRFIYNGTVDILRRVSQHVTIGRAYRKSGPMNAWFALVRRNARPEGISS